MWRSHKRLQTNRPNQIHVDFHEALGCRPDWKADPSSVDEINAGKFAHDGDFKTFKQVFMLELAGSLDELKEPLSRIIHRMCLSEHGDKANPDAKPDPAAGKWAANLLYHAFDLERISEVLPNLRTYLTLHAAFRWDQSRKFKCNDLADIRHAASALPYCQMFLTERSLSELIHGKHCKLTERFSCRTFAEPELVLQHLCEIGV